ncbi:MAG TPA: ABC-2 transporter permease [Bacillota bacterium]|nr:ABC-2 transporter permease [Bacillota bacterium]
MKGLLLKDFYTLVVQMKLFLLMIAIFTLVPNFSMSGFAIVYAAMLPITALAYDERSKWTQLAAMMPYTPTELVVSKYILGYATVAGAFVLSLIAQTVIGSLKGSPIGGMDVLVVFITANIALLIQAANLPLIFHFGVEKGRLLFMGIIAAMVMIGMGAGTFLLTLFGNASAALLRWAILAGSVTVILNILSIRIAVAMYEKRQY